MSLSPCRLQLLPHDIIDRIIDYLPPSSFPSIAGYVQVPIMHLFPRWRTAYIHKYFSSCVVSYSMTSEGHFAFRILPLAVSSPIGENERVIRTLTIDVTCWAPFMNGEIVEWMQISPDFSSLNLAPATTLIIDACGGTHSHYYGRLKILDEVKNLAAFFRHIRSVTLNAANIKLLLSECDQLLLADIDTKLIEKSISELTRGRNFTFSSGKHTFLYSTISPSAISGLTSFCHNGTSTNTGSDAAVWGIEVVRHNSGTLKSVDIPSFELELLGQFLFKDATPVIYSSLVKMDIGISHSSEMLIDSVDPISGRYSGIHVDHFPMLKYLRFDGLYMMVVGHLFGSENRSLEHLDVTISPMFPDVDDSSRPWPVAILTRFYGLKNIRFATHNGYNHDGVVPPEYSMVCTHILRLLAFSSPALYCISMELTDGGSMLAFLNDNSLWMALGKLDIPDAFFSFVDIFNLLKGAPMLQHLDCAIDDESPTFNGVELGEQPEYLNRLYYPLNVSLLGFMVRIAIGYEEVNVYSIALSTLLLANMCPRLRYVETNIDICGDDAIRHICFGIDNSTRLTNQAKSLSQKIISGSYDEYSGSDSIDGPF